MVTFSKGKALVTLKSMNLLVMPSRFIERGEKDPVARELFITAGHRLVANCVFQLVGARQGVYGCVFFCLFVCF